MPETDLLDFETDPLFKQLPEREQERVRISILREEVLPDPDFRGLPPPEKEKVASRFMATAPPEGFLSSLLSQQTEAIRALPGAIPDILAAPPPAPPPVRVPSLAARWGHPPSISQPTAEDLIAKPTGEQPWADIRKGALASVIGAATGQPETPPLEAPRLPAGPDRSAVLGQFVGPPSAETIALGTDVPQPVQRRTLRGPGIMRAAPPVAAPGPLLASLRRLLPPQEPSLSPGDIADAQIRQEARERGMSREEYVDWVNPSDAGVRRLERFGKGVGLGALGTTGGMLGFAEYLTGSKDAEQIGKMIRDVEERYSPERPDFSDAVASGAGSMAMFFIPGILVARGAQALAAVPTIARALGVSASAGLESATEAGAVYKEAKRKGKSEDEAKASASVTFWANAPIIYVTNKLGIFGEQGKSLRRAMVSAIMEGSQEAAQEVISSLSQMETSEAKEVLTSFGVGAITGSGVVGAGRLAQRISALGEQRPAVIRPEEAGRVVPGETAPSYRPAPAQVPAEPPRAPTIAPEPPAAPPVAVQPERPTVAPVAPRTEPVPAVPSAENIYQQAVGLVRETGAPSVSMLQRRLELGFNQAALLIERMEAEGIVSKPTATEPRTVIQAPPSAPAVTPPQPAPVTEAPTLTEGQRVAYTPEGSQGSLVGTIAAVHADGTVDFQPTAGDRMLDVSAETVRPLVERTGTVGAPGGLERRAVPPAELPPPAAPTADVPSEKPKYQDGRLIPQSGDEVSQMVRGFGGTPAYIYGEVYQAKGGLRVRTTGSAAMLGSAQTGKTYPLDANWTVKGDPEMARREQARKDKEEGERRATDQEKADLERRIAENVAKYGELDPNSLKPGDVIEDVDGVRMVFTENYKSDRGELWPLAVPEGEPLESGGTTIGNLDRWRKVEAAPSPPPTLAALRAERDRLQAENARLREETGEAVAAKVPASTPTPTTLTERLRGQGKMGNVSAKLRSLADGMQAQIDAKMSPAIGEQNLTARRARIATGIRSEGDRLAGIQTTLRALADAHEAGTVPESLKGITTRSALEELRSSAKFPSPSLTRSDITEVLRATERQLSVAEGRRVLGRLQNQDIAYFQTQDIPAILAILNAAEKKGVAVRWMRDRISAPKRLMDAGITNQEQFERASKDLDFLEKARPAVGPSLDRQVKELEAGLIGLKIPGYFPTPKPVVDEMVSRAGIESGMRVLEPSAGKGDIADAIKASHPDADLSVVEWSDSLRKILEAKGYAPSGRDFLEEKGEYDRILMNPPFETGQDADHVRHAYDLLAPGGKVVAIMSEGTFSRGDKKATGFREWLESVGGTNERLPEGSFQNKTVTQRSGVASRIVEIEKPTEEAPRAATEPIIPAPPPEPAGEAPEPAVTPPPPGTPAGEPRGGEPPARPEAAVAPAVGGEVGLPTIERTTPAPGTAERAKLEVDYKAADEAQEKASRATYDLKREREKARGTLKSRSFDKKIEKAEAVSDAAYKESERLRKEWYQAQIEDGATQTENRLLQLVSGLEVQTRTIPRENVDAYSKLRDRITPKVRAEVERLAQESEQSPQIGQGKLSAEDDAKAIERAIAESTDDFIRYPLQAKEQPEGIIAKNAQERIASRIYGERLKAYQRQAEKKVDALVDAGLPRDRLPRGAREIDNTHDYARIDETVKEAEERAEAFRTETQAQERATAETQQAALARFDNPTEADTLARRMVRELTPKQIAEIRNRLDDTVGMRLELLSPQAKKWIQGIPEETLKAASDLLRDPRKNPVTWPYEPEKGGLRKSDLPEDAQRFNGQRGWSTTYKGKPAWTNGHIIEFSEPPKGINLEPKPDVPLDVAISKGKTEPLTPIARELHGEGSHADVVILRTEDGKVFSVDSTYWDHFTARYPGMEASREPTEKPVPIMLKQKGKLVGVVMPMRYEPTPTVAGLMERAKGTATATTEKAAPVEAAAAPEAVPAVTPPERTEGVAGTQAEPTPTEGKPTVVAPKGGESVGPGAMATAEAVPTKPFTTSMKNAVKDKERQERGEPQLFTVNRMSNPAAWDEAMRLIDENPDAQSYLIATLEANPRATTPVENALLLHRSVQLINERNDIAKQLFDAVEGGFEDRAADLRRRVERVSDEMIQLEQVGRATGTKSGQSLQARKMMANEDYSLAKMEMRKRIAKGGEKLTPEEQATVERQAKRIAELEQALDARVTGAEGRASQQEADQVVKEIKERVAVEDAADKRTGVKRDVPAERDAIISGITKASEDVPLEDLRPYIQRLAENFVREGITERDPLIDAVHGVLQDIFPDITRRQTMDAISGFGDFKPLNPDPIKAKLRDVKGQMQQVAKLEDIAARKPLQKTGLERRVPSNEERRLIKLVEELKRRYGVVVTDPATQLKSALDAIKTRLRNDIADLEYQIATRKKIIKDKTGVAYDAEAQVLKDRRDALKAQFDEVFGKPEMTPEQRVKLAMGAVERSIADLEARIKAKDIAPRRFLGKTPVTPELEAARVRREALTAQLQELRDLDTAYQEQRQIKALERSIAEYERRAKEGDFAPAKGKPGVETEAVKEAMRRRDVARDALEALREQAGYYDQVRVRAALAALEKANAELSRRINAGEIEAKKKPSGTPVTPELAAARMEHELLSGILQDLRKAARPKKTPEEIALQSLKTRMKNRTAELQEKLARGDFSARPRREVVLDAEGTRLRGALATVKREYQEGLIKDKLARRTRAQKILAGALETTNLTRILMTSFDLSAVLRQGGFIAFGHPLRGLQAFPDMFRALRSKANQAAINEEILSRPNAPLYARAKLYFSDQAGTLAQMEEAYMSRWAEKIPGIGASQRAFTTFLNRLRADSFDAMVKNLGRKGEVTTEEAKAIANFINVATGRGKVGMSEATAVGLNTVFFSPRYLASRFQLLAGQPLYRGTWRTRKQIAGEYAKFLAGAAVVYALAHAAGGDIETDPRSSDFGKIRFGKTRLDPMTGLLQITTLTGRLAAGETKTLKGKVLPIRQEAGGRKLPFGKGDAADVIGRFLRTKLSPNVGAAVDILAGKTVVGEPATLESTAQRSLTPLAGQDVYDAMNDQGVPKGTIMGILAFFGMGLQVHEDRKRQPPPSAARRLFRTLRDSFSRGRETRPSP